MPGPSDTNMNTQNNYNNSINNYSNHNSVNYCETNTNNEAAASDVDAAIVYGEAKYLTRPP